VWVGVSVGVAVGVLVGVLVGVPVGVLVGVLVGVAVGVSCPQDVVDEAVAELLVPSFANAETTTMPPMKAANVTAMIASRIRVLFMTFRPRPG
jgi:hypothetical protein